MDGRTTKCNIENLAIFLGFPILWATIGGILFARQNFQLGGLFIGAAGTLTIIFALMHKKKELNLQGHIIVQDRILYRIIAIGSICLGVGGPYLLALFER